MKRILLTELGNTASGDIALWKETVRRLASRGWAVTLLHRLADPAPLQQQGLATSRRVYLPLPELPWECGSIQGMVDHLATHHPGLLAAIKEQVAAHDITAIAPGGKFLQAYAYQKALVVSAVALHLKRPVWMLHQSIGPLELDARSHFLREILVNARGVLLRDDKSVAFVRNRLDIGPAHIVRTRDPLFAVQAPRDDEAPAYRLGINFRMGHNGWSSPEGILGFIQRIAESVPMSDLLVYSTTYDLSADLCAQLEPLGTPYHRPVLTAADLLAYPRQCAVNITDSFHGAIFSRLLQRPTVLCQPDHDSWKLQGTFTARTKVNRIHPGLVHPAHIRSATRRCLHALRHPRRWVRAQQKEIDGLIALTKTGWDAFFRNV